MPLYAACDLHSNNTVLAVLDEAGSLKLRQRVPNDLDLIGAALAPFRDQLQGVAVESTYNAYWLLDGLDRAGRRRHAGHVGVVDHAVPVDRRGVRRCEPGERVRLGADRRPRVADVEGGVGLAGDAERCDAFGDRGVVEGGAGRFAPRRRRDAAA